MLVVRFLVRKIQRETQQYAENNSIGNDTIKSRFYKSEICRTR